MQLERSDDVWQFSAKKPNYEVGAAMPLKLSFAPKQQQEAPANNAAEVWALSANDVLDDDVDLIDSDELLDDFDLKKPDPASLRGLFLGCIITCNEKDVT